MNKFANMFSSQKRLSVYGLLGVLGALITFASLMASPSDPKNAVFLGYSLERILLGIVVLVPGIALLFLTLSLLRKPEYSQHMLEVVFQHRGTSDKTLAVSVFVFLLLWVLLFLPPYRLGVFASYLSRLFPVLVWMLVASGAAVLIVLFERKQGVVQAPLTGNRTILKTSLIVFFILLLVVLVVAITGLGIRHPADYWYSAGVPVLGLQILFSLLAGAVFILLEPRLGSFKQSRLDLFIFIAIWVLAAWFWGREPLSPNYFMPDTADNIIYPYSDGATFDAGAQTALIGLGLFNGWYFERVLYSVFLAYLHIFFGQNYEILMTIQAVIFAIFPAVIYLIGRELHSRALGVSAGILLAIRGVNAIIAAKWIDTASPKMMLTDFPTAIGIAIFLLLFVKWIKEPSKIGYLFWVGAVFGLTLMVRSHILTLLPVVLVCMPLFMKLHWRQIVLAGLLVLLGIFTVTLPWEIRNQSRGIPMYSAYYSRIVTILRYRYNIGVDAYIPPQEMGAAKVETSFSHTFIRQRLIRMTVEPVCDSAVCSIANHFLHNAITSFVSLPSSLVFDDIWNTVKADTPYWKKDWNEGAIGTIGTWLIFLNLAVISLGVGSVWGRTRTIALLPPLFFTTYLFTNSIGLTSGGRYVAPVDWIVYLYFIAGGLQLVIWFLKVSGVISATEPVQIETISMPSLKKENYARALPTLVFILAIGALLPAVELFFMPRYQVRQPEEILAQLEEAGLLEQTGFSRDDLLEFLSQPNAMIREGRALYSRYYPSGDGEQDRSTYYRYLDYQRLVFTLIGPYAPVSEGVVIPGFPPPFPLHAADVVVLGCWNTTYYAPFIDAVVVFSTSGEGYVYNRAPEDPLQCPLPEPKQ